MTKKQDYLISILFEAAPPINKPVVTNFMTKGEDICDAILKGVKIGLLKSDDAKFSMVRAEILKSYLAIPVADKAKYPKYALFLSLINHTFPGILMTAEHIDVLKDIGNGREIKRDKAKGYL